MVEFDKPIGLAFVDLAEDIEQLLKIKVDLVSRRAIKPRMLKSIEQELIYV
jgi:predicted nucleotidyltransferase